MYGLRRGSREQLGIAAGRGSRRSALSSAAHSAPRLGSRRAPALVALAARHLNRPVKLVRDAATRASPSPTYRAETAPSRPARRHAATASSPRYSHEGWELTSRPDAYFVGGIENSAHCTPSAHVKTRIKMVHADRNTPGFMRSPPELPYIYALESAIDELAVKLGMDPVELRRINDPDDRPDHGKPYTSRSLMQCYDEAAEPSAGSAAMPSPARCATATG